MRPSAPSKPKAGARRPFALPRARPCPAGALALAGADLRALVRELSPYCQNDPDRARIEGPSLMLEQQAAQAMAVAVYELTTNAVKYGAFSTPKGRVSVEWSCDLAQRLTFRWRNRRPGRRSADAPRVRCARHGTDYSGPAQWRAEIRLARGRRRLRDHPRHLTAKTRIFDFTSIAHKSYRNKNIRFPRVNPDRAAADQPRCLSRTFRGRLSRPNPRSSRSHSLVLPRMSRSTRTGGPPMSRTDCAKEMMLCTCASLALVGWFQAALADLAGLC